MSAEKQRQNLGFGDVFDNVEPSKWNPPKSAAGNDTVIDEDHAEKVAASHGFVSREPARHAKKKSKKLDKELMDQINFRAKASVIEDFRDFCKAQEPAWPMGYTLERAMVALKKELSGRTGKA